MSGEPSSAEHSEYHNEKGVIAETYRELQALHILDKIKALSSLPNASYNSCISTVFHSAEIALLNLADLITRITTDIDCGLYHNAAVKQVWVRGFHRILVALSRISVSASAFIDHKAPLIFISVQESPANQQFASAINAFQEQMLREIQSNRIEPLQLIKETSIDDHQMFILHLFRVCYHETMIWEEKLSHVAVNLKTDYQSFIFSKVIASAVHDRHLTGDTFFTQFRALHQIPELLCAEGNDHLQEVIVALRGQHYQRAIRHLQIFNTLWDVILLCLDPISDNLTAFDYHKIRENLGLTSGSHSVNIHYHLFRDLYQQLGKVFCDLIGHYKDSEKFIIACQKIDILSTNDASAFLLHSVMNELVKVCIFVDLWRARHLHLPRNNIGGSSAKSLVGSPDAIETVKKMRDRVKKNDPLQLLLEARGITAERDGSIFPPYSFAGNTLDDAILQATGQITKAAFQSVQERTGVFAEKGKFSPPDRREA